MEITQERYRELEKAELKLDALEAGGVDNWEGIDFALGEYRRSIEIDEIINDACTEVAEAVCKEVEEPAGSGCGFGIRQEGIDQMILIIRNTVKKVIEREKMEV